MAFNSNITPGRPPLLWSDVHDAFTKVNENFDILVATVGNGSGLTPIDFGSLDSDVTPTVDNVYTLGGLTHRWRGVYTGEHTTVDPLNGLWAGNAQIKGVGLTINLPENSTIGGDPLTGIGASLIIDPDKTFFKEIQVDNDLSVVAAQFADSFNLLSGSGINLSVNSSADSIEVTNTGILSITDGSGISHTTVSGVATITNTGVRSLQSTTSIPSGRTAGAGININGSTGDNLKITNTGVISISSGVGITVSTDTVTGDVTITNSAPAVNAFAQIQVDGDTINRLQADSVSDVLNINGGEGITLTKNTSTDTLTITVNPVFDLKGSVFGDDSSLIVDAVSNKVYAGNGFYGDLTGNVIGNTVGYHSGDVKGSVFGDDSSILVDAVGNYIYGNVVATTLRTTDTRVTIGAGAGGDGLQGADSIAIGMSAGGFTQGDYAVAIGSGAGNIGQGNNAVAIGTTAGADSGDYAISIGNGAGYPTAVSQSIAINASGFTLDAPAAGFYVNPIRASTTSARPIVYDTTTKELKYTSTLEFVNSTISTSDSSGITVDVITTFNSDIVVENDLTVAERLTVKGSRVINLAELKSVVAASTDFANFQARIAALV